MGLTTQSYWSCHCRFVGSNGVGLQIDSPRRVSKMKISFWKIKIALKSLERLRTQIMRADLSALFLSLSLELLLA